LEHPHRSALENHVHRTPRLGNHGLLNVRIGISGHPDLIMIVLKCSIEQDELSRM
jgi:hypothetical protein